MQDCISQKVDIKYGIVLHTQKKGISSKEQRLDSSSLSSESYILAFVWPCLDITSLERNVNRIRPIPNPVTTKLLVLTTPTPLQGHMIFSMSQT